MKVISVAEESLDSALSRLDALSKRHIGAARQMTEAFGGALYGLDLLAFGAINRSMAHIRGFVSLIRDRNILSAGALLRLQLDTALRFSAAWLVDSPHDFAVAILEGQRVRDLKDSTGQRMTDSYLVQRLGEEFEWIPRVYERTSGYVHFSRVHMLASISMTSKEEHGAFQLKVSSDDPELPESLYAEAAEAFIASTEILLKHVEGWTFTKENPALVAKLRELRDAPNELPEQ